MTLIVTLCELLRSRAKSSEEVQIPALLQGFARP